MTTNPGDAMESFLTECCTDSTIGYPPSDECRAKIKALIEGEKRAAVEEALKQYETLLKFDVQLAQGLFGGVITPNNQANRLLQLEKRLKELKKQVLAKLTGEQKETHG